jgi:hypothetical protein
MFSRQIHCYGISDHKGLHSSAPSALLVVVHVGTHLAWICKLPEAFLVRLFAMLVPLSSWGLFYSYILITTASCISPLVAACRDSDPQYTSWPLSLSFEISVEASMTSYICASRGHNNMY